MSKQEHSPIVPHSCTLFNKAAADDTSMSEWRGVHLATLDEMVGETACTDLVALVVRTLQKLFRVGVSYVVLKSRGGKTALADVTPRGIQREPWRDGLRIFTELFHFFLIFQFPSAGRRRLRAAGASKAVVGGHFHK